MTAIKNNVKGANIIFTGSHNNFRYIGFYGAKILKPILTFLYSTKYNEVNICHSDIQKHVS